MTENKIIIYPEKVNQLAKEGSEIVFKKEAEEALLTLLKMQEFIEKTIEEVKVSIIKSGRYVDPDFKGVIGEHVKAVYRTFGTKYKFKGNVKKIPKKLESFLNVKTTATVKSEEVDKYLKETGKLPGMIEENPRVYTLSLQKINEK